MATDTLLVTSAALKSIVSQQYEGQNVYWTTDPAVEIPIKLGTEPSCITSDKPMTVMERFENTVREVPDREALKVQRQPGTWKSWTYKQYYEDVRKFAKAAIHSGLQPHRGVAIIGFNSPEWLVANLGAIYAGGISCGMYTTNGPEACQYILENSKSNICVVEDDAQLQKILAVRSSLPELKAIVQYLGEPKVKDPQVFSWNQFLGLSTGVSDNVLNARIAAQRPGHCAAVIYTSGTTGNPKGVMLSHDNITWTSANIASHCLKRNTITPEPMNVVSYLPLSHIAAQDVDVYTPMYLGGTIYFARPDALKGTIVQTLAEVRPHYFFGVPRVWEKFEDKLREIGAQNTGIKKTIGEWAKSVGLEGNKAILAGQDLPWGWSVADKVVFSNIKKAIGLDRSILNFSGAAPISVKTLEYFMSINVPVFEVYGMSESSGPHTVNLPGPHNATLATVGQLFPGMKTKLDNKDKDGNGEICMKGRHVFMGYLYNPEATANTIDSDGWLHSGDLGKEDANGFLKITGRIKELIITAGGENIPPVLIEDTVKGECPAISNAVVLGEKQKYLAILLTLKSEPDADGQPTDKFAPQTVTLIQEAGSSAKTISEAVNCPKVKSKIEEAIARANKKATSNAQQIRKWTFLTNDFTVAGGELTATMKLKRRVVNDKYADVIASLFPSDEPAIKSKL